MARKAKQHIRNPKLKSLALCGRKSIAFSDKASEASCEICLNMAASGTLEELQLEKQVSKNKSANNKGDPKLTAQQRRFASSPIVTTNPRQAAIDAGYTEEYARAHAHALRKQLAPLIMEYQDKAKEKTGLSIAKVQTELASMGFANVIDYFNIDEVSGAMTPKQLNELTRAQAAAIQEVKLMDYTDPLTGKTHFVIERIKLADKRANLVELGKTMGMFNRIVIEDKREQTLLMDNIPTDALEEAEKLLIAAANKAVDELANRNAIDGEFTALPAPTEEVDGQAN